MYKVGTITTINEHYNLIDVFRDEELNFSTINLKLEGKEGGFIYHIHFDFILKEDEDIEALITNHLNKLKK